MQSHKKQSGGQYNVKDYKALAIGYALLVVFTIMIVIFV